VYASYVDEPVMMVSGAGTKHYFHQNHLYSVAAMTNSVGAVVERYRYDAYGKRTVTNAAGTTIAASTIGQQRGFTGYYLDAETGLYYARDRMYSPLLGRFITRDSFSPYMKVWHYYRLLRGEVPFVSLPLTGYGDGFNLYSAYFAPNGMDPYGGSTLHIGLAGAIAAGDVGTVLTITATLVGDGIMAAAAAATAVAAAVAVLSEGIGYITGVGWIANRWLTNPENGTDWCANVATKFGYGSKEYCCCLDREVKWLSTQVGLAIAHGVFVKFGGSALDQLLGQALNLPTARLGWNRAMQEQLARIASLKSRHCGPSVPMFFLVISLIAPVILLRRKAWSSA